MKPWKSDCPPAVTAGLSLLFLLGGCHIDTHKDGKNDNVDIGTPFGSLHVKTDQTAAAQTGLTPYPGATPVHKDGDNNGSADVNLSFGGFKLGVHAVDLRTGDSTERVLAFYRNDMHRYGAVITCRGQHTVGTPARTSEGLTCDDHQVVRGHDMNGDEVQLRAGSETHQHIVGIHNEDGGTRIGLVALDLPGELKNHDANDQE